MKPTFYILYPRICMEPKPPDLYMMREGYGRIYRAFYAINDIDAQEHVADMLRANRELSYAVANEPYGVYRESAVHAYDFEKRWELGNHHD